jgi:pimeloyl-ACP methyl ester carboxylesterase
MVEGLRGKGRRVLVMANLHGIDAPEISGLPHPQVRKAMAIIKMLDAKGIRKADFAGHSEGAIISAIVGKLRPDLVRNVVLHNPAGVKENESTVPFIGRSVLEAMRGLFRRKEPPSQDDRVMAQIGAKEAAEYRQKDRLHTLKEFFSISNADVRRLLREMQEQHGIGVSITSAEGDMIFPHARRPRVVSSMTGVPLRHIRKLQGGHLFEGREETDALVTAIDEELDSHLKVAA